MMQGLAGWMDLTGEPGQPADEERFVARRPLGRICLDDRGARRAVARAPRRRRLRLRHLALRDGAARADVRRDLGGDEWLHAAAADQLGSSVDRSVPELRDRGRLDRRRLPEAEVLGELLRAPSAGPSSPATSASPTSRRATATETSSRRCSTTPSRRARRRNGSTIFAAADVPSAPVNDVVTALETRRRAPARTSSSSSTPTWERCARLRRRFVSRTPIGRSVGRRSGASTPSRSSSSSAATSRSACVSSPPQVCSDDRTRPGRLRTAAARPTVAQRSAHRAQFRPQLRGRRRADAGRRRSHVGGVSARGDQRAAEGRPARSERRVDVRVRQPHGLLARPSHLHRPRPAADGLRGRSSVGAEPRSRAGDGRRRLGGGEPRLALDRLRGAVGG